MDWCEVSGGNAHRSLHLESQREPDLVQTEGVRLDLVGNEGSRTNGLNEDIECSKWGGCKAPLERTLHWAEEYLRGLGVRLVSHPLECKG